MPAERGPSGTGGTTRLLIFGALLMAISPGVLLGWGFTLGIVAGLGIAYGLWWVNHAR